MKRLLILTGAFPFPARERPTLPAKPGNRRKSGFADFSHTYFFADSWPRSIRQS